MHAAHTRVSLFTITIALAGLAGGLLYAVAAPPGAARADSVIAVDSTSQGLGVPGCTLPEAILAANHDASSVPLPASNGLSFETGCAAGSGNDLIDLAPGTYAFSDVIDDASNYAGPAATPIITSAVQIEGHGALIQRTGSTNVRAFAVLGGDLVLNEVHVKGFAARGGFGGNAGGGGGLGAGGAIYVHDGSLLVQWSTFEANSATGGNGGGRQDIGGVGGGGGGGMGGNGGANSSSGGGGGGSRSGGASGGSFGTGGGGGGTLSPAGGQSVFDPYPGAYRCGGEGAVNDSIVGEFLAPQRRRRRRVRGRRRRWRRRLHLLERRRRQRRIRRRWRWRRVGRRRRRSRRLRRWRRRRDGADRRRMRLLRRYRWRRRIRRRRRQRPWWLHLRFDRRGRHLRRAWQRAQWRRRSGTRGRDLRAQFDDHREQQHVHRELRRPRRRRNERVRGGPGRDERLGCRRRDLHGGRRAHDHEFDDRGQRVDRRRCRRRHLQAAGEERRRPSCCRTRSWPATPGATSASCSAASRHPEPATSSPRTPPTRARRARRSPRRMTRSSALSRSTSPGARRRWRSTRPVRRSTPARPTSHPPTTSGACRGRGSAPSTSGPTSSSAARTPPRRSRHRRSRLARVSTAGTRPTSRSTGAGPTSAVPGWIPTPAHSRRPRPVRGARSCSLLPAPTSRATRAPPRTP